MSRNEITGDEIKTKVTSKEYEDGYDRIFKKKPQSLDAAYERRAMMQGLVTNPLFDENKELVEDEYSHLGTLIKEVEWFGVDLAIAEDMTNTPQWPESEERIDIIASNGNDGLHYEEKG
jgi:hypothetical protein